MNIRKQLAKGLQHHQAGRLAEAGEIYRDILKVDPNNVDALNLMGVILHVAGDLENAIALIHHATELAPDYLSPLVNLGNALQAAGRLEDAVNTFEKAMALDPNSAEAANNLASALNELARFDRALEVAESAIKINPSIVDLHINRGNALLGLERAEEALESYHLALEENPAHGVAWYNMGNAYADLERYDEAYEPYRKAVDLDRGNAEKHYNLANTLLRLDRFAEAVESFSKAIEIRPEYIDAHCNMASALQSLGRTDEAIGNLSRALESEPESSDLHWNLALAMLQHGDYQNGWKEYEWRWQTPTFADFKRDFGKPEWNGEDLDGKTILIHAEQGFGDAIEFVRYAPLVARRGGRVVLECRSQLNRLFSTIEGVSTVVNLGDPLPEFDIHIPLMSLPRAFETTLETIPDGSRYLSAPAGVPVDSRIAEASGLKVGFAWAGSPTRVDNRKRSCDLDWFKSLFAVPGTSFFSLQVGKFQKQLDQLGEDSGIVDLAPDLGDFADTAAAIQVLDLIISVDTSVLHLAGALGKPTFAVMSRPTGFLWMNERNDTPWYPTVRLFRQPEPGNWQDVFNDVKDELAKLASTG